jgi:hypothetical protein
MNLYQKLTRAVTAGAVALTLGACAQAGTLGDVLGGVLNAPTGGNQVSATVSGVDTRSSQLFLRQSDGTTIAVTYDNRTQVVYNNQTYGVTSLENGDQVTARITNNGNGNYYTDYIQVTQSVSSTNGGSNTTNGQLFSMSGNVRQVDRTNGWFTLTTQNNGTITVTMPYNPRSTDVNRFNNLRSGDYVQIQAYYLNSSRYELANFF